MCRVRHSGSDLSILALKSHSALYAAITLQTIETNSIEQLFAKLAVFPTLNHLTKKGPITLGI